MLLAPLLCERLVLLLLQVYDAEEALDQAPLDRPQLCSRLSLVSPL
jgi:hypothetical protein